MIPISEEKIKVPEVLPPVKNFVSKIAASEFTSVFYFSPRYSNSIVSKTRSSTITLESIDRIYSNVFAVTDDVLFGRLMKKLFPEGEGLIQLKDNYCRYLAVSKFEDPIEKLASIIGENPELLRKLLDDMDSNYSVFYIWKDAERTKKRWIEAPNEDLKRVQRKLMHHIFYRIAPTKFAHGFIRGKSIVSNANEHVGKKFVLKMDLKNFFPSISKDMVYSSMEDILDNVTGPVITKAIDLCLLKGRLPQGAPTSPALSNIYMRYVDLSLWGIAKKLKINYSRYADDLIFSSDSDILYKIIPIIKKCIARFNLAVNEKKVKVLKYYQRQSVTGVVVNSKPSVKSITRRKLRAYMHNIIVGKVPLDRVNYNKLKGHVNFINMVNPEQGKWFEEKLRLIINMASSS